MRLEINSLKKVVCRFCFGTKTEEDKKTEEQEKEDKLENKLEDKKETEKQEDTKVEIPLQEENSQLFKFRKRRESKRPYKRTIERERKITYVIKEPLTDNKEVNNTKAQKDKDNNNQVILKKKEKRRARR